MRDYWKVEILNTILQTEKAENSEAGNSMKAVMKFTVGN